MSTLPLSRGPEVPSRRPSEARPRPKPFWWWLPVGALLYWAFAGVQFNLAELIAGIPQMQDWLHQSLPPDVTPITDVQRYGFPPEFSSWVQLNPFAHLDASMAEIRERWWANTFPQTVVGATLQTIQMAIAGTVVAVPFSLPFAFLAARNTSPHPAVYHTVKLFVNVLRSIPDFAVGLMLITAIGLGPFTGTMALAFHTWTVLIKLFAESIENIDEGVVEAIRATGAPYLAVVTWAVLPQVIPDLISMVLYRFETNIRSASVLGLIGAGGIGFIMKSDFSLFQYQQAATTVLVLIALVMVVDYTSARLRRWVL